MKKILLMTALTFFPLNAYAQPSLADQLDAIDAVQSRNEAAQKAAQDAAAKQAAAAKQKKEEAALADKKRDQSYEDRMREFDLQQRSLEIQAQKATVDRANEYIDQDLKARAAETDVIQSHADTNRAVSSGVKSYLEKSAPGKDGGVAVEMESEITRQAPAGQ